MKDLSLHALDLIENSIRAGARRVGVRVEESHVLDRLTVEIVDNGEGMDGTDLARAFDPFFTTKPGKRTGLGLPFLAQAAREAGGDATLVSVPGKGTTLTAVFVLSHPDCKPLGDMGKTIRLLGYAHPDVEFTYDRNVVGEQGA